MPAPRIGLASAREDACAGSQPLSSRASSAPTTSSRCSVTRSGKVGRTKNTWAPCLASPCASPWQAFPRPPANLGGYSQPSIRTRTLRSALGSRIFFSGAGLHGARPGSPALPAEPPIGEQAAEPRVAPEPAPRASLGRTSQAPRLRRGPARRVRRLGVEDLGNMSLDRHRSARRAWQLAEQLAFIPV